MRERERERERAQIAKREEEETLPANLELQSNDHRPSSSPTIAPRRSSIAASRRSSIAAPRRSSITTPRRLILPSISPPPRDLTFYSAARSQFDRIWWIFLLGFVSFVNECGIDSLSTCLQLRKCMENWVAWLCKAFSIKMFERNKHWNWFSVKWILRQPKSLNTFFFPKNSISGKYFMGTKHSLSLKNFGVGYQSSTN